MSGVLKLCIFAFLCIVPWPSSVQGHKMLVIVPVYGKSHWNYMKVFVNELIDRGHEVTCITSISMGKHKPVNYTEILIDPPFKIQNFGECTLPPIFEHLCIWNRTKHNNNCQGAVNFCACI